MFNKEMLGFVKMLAMRPVGENRPGQKFPRGVRIKIDDVMPPEMSHFDCGVEAIVEFTYGQKFPEFDENDIYNYSLLLLDGDVPTFTAAWYREDQLTLINADIEKGLQIIEQYYKARAEE